MSEGNYKFYTGPRLPNSGLAIGQPNVGLSPDYLEDFRPQMGSGYSPGNPSNWGQVTGEVKKQLANAAMKKAAPILMKGLGVGTVGAGILGTSLLMGLGKSLFGRRKGPNPYDVERDALARSGQGMANAYAGQLGSLGQEFQREGLADMNRYESQYLDLLQDPNMVNRESARVAANLSASRAGINPTIGLLGGGLQGARFGRQMSQFDPALASSMAQIGQNRIGNLANAYSTGRQFGAGRFQQGLGLNQQAYGTQAGGLQGMMGYLGQRKAEDMQQKAQRQAMLAGLGQAAGMAIGSRGRFG